MYRICKQLGEHGLITWSPFTGDGGIGEITAHGIDVIEGQRQSDIAVHLVHNYTTNISGSTNVIVGDNNRQAVSASFEELLRAVNSYPGSDADKEESKNLLAQLAKSPVFAQVVGQLTRFGLEHLAKLPERCVSGRNGISTPPSNACDEWKAGSIQPRLIYLQRRRVLQHDPSRLLVNPDGGIYLYLQGHLDLCAGQGLKV